MAEQIRSFWSHLCGIFGAIFGMIAGGTLVTIEQADAVTGARTCGTTRANYSQKTLDNGAVVYTCYGGGWLCARVDSKSKYSSCYGNNLDGNGECYLINVYKNYPRYYTYFMGCADGYYSTEGIGYTTAISSNVSSSAAVPGLSMIQSLGATSGIGVRKGYNPFTRETTSCYTSDNVTFNTSTYELRGESAAFLGSPYNQAYERDPELITAGKCKKCPSYGEYAARSAGGTYAKSVSSCFMTSSEPRYDAADQPDGVATGTFIWTNLCNYDESSSDGTTGGDTTGGDTTGGSIAGLPSCERMKASGDCSIMLDDAGTNKITVNKIVRSITGLGLKEAKAIVDSAPKMVIEDFSCEAAECYKEIFDANNADVTITEY